MYRCAKLWSILLLGSAGVRLTSIFETPLEKGRGYIFMSNHQSMYDVPVLISGMPGEVRFLTKKSLFRIPIFGWALHASGFIPVDRQDRRSGRRAMDDAARLLERGVSVMIFPEQTRSPDGRILPFRRGAFLIARRAGVPIVPIGVRGTRDIRPKGSYWVRPGTVEVRYGAPVMPSSDQAEERKHQIEEVRATVARLADSDLAPARGRAS